MTKLIHIICLGSLLLGAMALPAAAQGRGDHDTPWTQRRDEAATPQYRQGFCHVEGVWLVCRDGVGNWRRHSAHPQARWEWDDNRRQHGYGWHHERSRMLDGKVIGRRLHERGFRDLRDMKLRGDVYSAKAIDPYGRRVIVSVDPYTGRIVDVVRR
jgi:hypothetical protein